MFRQVSAQENPHCAPNIKWCPDQISSCVGALAAKAPDNVPYEFGDQNRARRAELLDLQLQVNPNVLPCMCSPYQLKR